MMKLKSLKPRRRLIMAGVVLLAMSVAYEEWQRAETNATHHHPATELTDTADDDGTEFLLTNKNFEVAVDLWRNPATRTHAADISYANFVFESGLHNFSPADFDRLARRAAAAPSLASTLTMTDKDITYALFSIGNFKATLNLTPIYATPEAILPTKIKPGLSGSLDF